MSLLMKALEKAAKDRGETRPVEPAPASPAMAAAAAAPAAAAPPSAQARSELSLEPMGAEPSAAARAEPARPAAPVPPRAGTPAAPPAPAGAREQAQAATVLQASAGRATNAGGGVGEYLRTHPVVVLGTVAGLFALGFGAYVYIQIFHPGLLTGRPTIAAPKGGVPPQAQAPVAPLPGGTAPGEPIPSANLLKEPATETAAAPLAAEAPRAKPQPPVPAAPAEDPARGNTIVVSPGSPEPALNPLLLDAYAALQAGQLDVARGLYQKLLASDPRNLDALLALASIAARQGNEPEATRLYLRILELEPRHALAQSGLIALLGRADPLAAESRLRQLIAREPSAFLHFTLGNLYADQSQWAAAQQAYFQAHHLDPANPDYAYNLAVGLEHVSQPKLALSFYRRALQLASARGRANFNSTVVQDRITRLAQQVE